MPAVQTQYPALHSTIPTKNLHVLILQMFSPIHTLQQVIVDITVWHQSDSALGGSL